MTRANASLALRPYLPADLPVVAEIFRASIEELTGEDYTPAQQDAWMAAADDEEAFGARLAGSLTLLALDDGEPVGFASLKGADHIDFLYVAPEAAGQGAASLLCDALEKLAAARGATRITTEASDTARGFFEKRGFLPQRRNTIALDGEWLGNTTMDKKLPAAAPDKAQGSAGL